MLLNVLMKLLFLVRAFKITLKKLTDEKQNSSNVVRYANSEKVEKSIVAINKLALQIELDDIVF